MTSSLSGEILRFSNSSFRIVSNSALADSKSKSSLNWVGGADLPPVLNFLSFADIKNKIFLPYSGCFYLESFFGYFDWCGGCHNFEHCVGYCYVDRAEIKILFIK